MVGRESRMPSVDPHVIIRMGSHAEKHYVEKTSKRLDGIIVGANLVEATPGATASLLAKRLARPYYIDPMTYAYACDVDWIKSDQKKRREGEVRNGVTGKVPLYFSKEIGCKFLYLS